MRPRRKKNLDKRLEVVSELLVNGDIENPLDWKLIYPALEHDTESINYPIDVEIGCGKGGFAVAYAQKHPQRNLLAVEKVPDVIVTAVEKAYPRKLNNLRFLISDAVKLDELFPEKSVDKLFINFCDPWLKGRYSKRRLTHRNFLEIYKKFLKTDGSIELKTDSTILFDFSLEEFKSSGFKLEYITYDLHNEVDSSENIVTEYESNFAAQGIAIKKLIASL